MLPDGTKASYAAFRLPDSPSPTQLTVSSGVMGVSLLPPRLWLLDARGTPLRDIGFRAFRPTRDAIQTVLRLDPGETFLVALSDPALVGQIVPMRLGAIADEDQSAYQVASIVIIPLVTSSGPRVSQVTYVYSGRITVAVVPVSRAP